MKKVLFQPGNRKLSGSKRRFQSVDDIDEQSNKHIDSLSERYIPELKSFRPSNPTTILIDDLEMKFIRPLRKISNELEIKSMRPLRKRSSKVDIGHIPDEPDMRSIRSLRRQSISNNNNNSLNAQITDKSPNTQIYYDEIFARELQGKLDSEISHKPKYIPKYKHKITETEKRIKADAALARKLDSDAKRLQRKEQRRIKSDENLARRLQEEDRLHNFDNLVPNPRRNPRNIFQQNNFFHNPMIENSNYQDLLRLAEQIGNVNNGLNQDEIDALPDHNFKCSSSYIQQEKECSICLLEYNDNDSLKSLPCFHHFHIHCISKWLRQDPSCPICRFKARVE